MVSASPKRRKTHRPEFYKKNNRRKRQLENQTRKEGKAEFRIATTNCVSQGKGPEAKENNAPEPMRCEENNDNMIWGIYEYVEGHPDQ